MCDVSQDDLDTIKEIVSRTMDIVDEHGEEWDRIECSMDLCSAHIDTPMDLQRLLDFDDFNFAHDVFGIRGHLDRSVYPGKLINCFRPRSALSESALKEGVV